MIVHVVLRAGQWLDLTTATITDRTVLLGVFMDAAHADRVRRQQRSQAWVGQTETWIEERVLDALGPEHDTLCELDRQPFCSCWLRTNLLAPLTPIPTLQKAN